MSMNIYITAMLSMLIAGSLAYVLSNDQASTLKTSSDLEVVMVSETLSDTPADCGLVENESEGCMGYATNCGGGGWGAPGICRVYCDSGHSFSCQRKSKDEGFFVYKSIKCGELIALVN